MSNRDDHEKKWTEYELSVGFWIAVTILIGGVVFILGTFVIALQNAT